MILAVAVGAVLEFVLHLQTALLWGLVAGVIVAPLVPAKAVCGIRPRDEASAS